MIAGLTRTWDNLLGRGEAAVTVPPFDGALRPNRRLDEATSRVPLAGVDCLGTVSGRLVASAENAIYALEDELAWRKLSEYEAAVTCIAPVGAGAQAVALATGDIVLEGHNFDGRRYRVSPNVHCITAMATSGTDLYVANGSATSPSDDWQLDLLRKRASGSIWRIDLESGKSGPIASGLAYPAGLAVDGASLVYSEAWKHRLVRIGAADSAKAQVLYSDLPGYPGRIAASGNGYWLAVFAPRSQLVEYVLKETAYRNRMIAEVPRPFWIAPKLRSGRSFYEPLQGGGVKHLGILKPWAPTMSAGLCVKLDGAFQPRLSLQSRADGATHGVTGIVEHRGRVFAAARGDGVVVSIALEELGTEQ